MQWSLHLRSCSSLSSFTLQSSDTLLSPLGSHLCSLQREMLARAPSTIGILRLDLRDCIDELVCERGEAPASLTQRNHLCCAEASVRLCQQCRSFTPWRSDTTTTHAREPNEPFAAKVRCYFGVGTSIGEKKPREVTGK